MATTFVIEVNERYRIVVAVGYIDGGVQYYPQEWQGGHWNWLRDQYGATVCFRSELRCREYTGGLIEGGEAV
jgi:hypothetical protein